MGCQNEIKKQLWAVELPTSCSLRCTNTKNSKEPGLHMACQTDFCSNFQQVIFFQMLKINATKDRPKPWSCKAHNALALEAWWQSPLLESALWGHSERPHRRHGQCPAVAQDQGFGHFEHRMCVALKACLCCATATGALQLDYGIGTMVLFEENKATKWPATLPKFQLLTRNRINRPVVFHPETFVSQRVTQKISKVLWGDHMFITHGFMGPWHIWSRSVKSKEPSGRCNSNCKKLLPWLEVPVIRTSPFTWTCPCLAMYQTFNVFAINPALAAAVIIYIYNYVKWLRHHREHKCSGRCFKSNRRKSPDGCGCLFAKSPGDEPPFALKKQQHGHLACQRRKRNQNHIRCIGIAWWWKVTVWRFVC